MKRSTGILCLILALVGAVAVVPISFLLFTEAASCFGTDDTGIRRGEGELVMSYNIKHATSTAQEAGMGHHPEDYKWSRRGKVVAQYIANANPALIGLQEVAHVPGTGVEQLDVIRSANPQLRWVYTDTSDPIGYQGGYSLLDKGRIRLNYQGQNGATLNRFAYWVKFRAPDQTEFIFVNLHAQFGQWKAQAQARSIGLARLISGLRAINDAHLPVILVGDFNGRSNETKPVFRAHLEKLPAAGFTDAAATTDDATTIPRVNSINSWGDTIGGRFVYRAINRSNSGSSHIDYVWTSGAAHATTWQIYIGPTVQWENIGDEKVPLTPQVASDHWPVLSHVVLGSAATTTLSVTAAAAVPEGWDEEQQGNAKAIIAAGQSMDLDTWTITVGVMTAMGESSLRNIDYGDAAGPDSRGLFQQRSGWGPEADRMNPTKASLLFFNALIKVPGYHSLEPTIAAHRTQINADPYHYAKYWDDAVAMVAALQGTAAQDCQAGASGDWAAVIEFALSKVGVYPYSWGGGSLDGPTEGFGSGAGIVGFDCSSFVRFVVYQKTGAILPRTAEAQAEFLQSRGFVHRTKSISELQPGDLLYYASGDSSNTINHTALVVAPGEIVEEPGSGRYVQHNQIKDRMPSLIWGYARFDPAAIKDNAE